LANLCNGFRNDLETEFINPVVQINVTQLVVNEVLRHDVGWLSIEQEEFGKPRLNCVKSGFENLFRILNEAKHLPLSVASSVPPSYHGRTVQ
jgi:hypothetical protein